MVDAIRKDLGLDRPVIVQFLLYLSRVLQGDLGLSMINNASVVGELSEALWPTAELVIACLVFAVPVGIALGAIAAMNHGGGSTGHHRGLGHRRSRRPVFLFSP